MTVASTFPFLLDLEFSFKLLIHQSETTRLAGSFDLLMNLSKSFTVYS